MSNQHLYIACVRKSTRDLPDIDAITPLSAADQTCLDELEGVLVKHGATSRFGVNLLHSHFNMAEDEVPLGETDAASRRQPIFVIKRSQAPEGAICKERRLYLADRNPVSAAYARMCAFNSQLLNNKLQKDLGLSPQDAGILFEDVKRFIALCANTDRPIAPPRIIDQGWHQFILVTRDYATFCDEYCGRFIHHQPADPFERSKDYGAERQRTRKLAQRAFGALSANWNESLSGGDCTHNCGTGECESVERLHAKTS